MSSKGAILSLQGVYKTYNLGEATLDVLKGIDLDIKNGEFIAILGPSGSGKSTLMNMIGLLDTPSKGKVFLEGHDVSKLPESDLAQYRGKKIGFVFQQFNLIRTLTALENVTLPTIFQNKSQKEREERATKLLTLVGLSERLHHKPTELSGGQQQRVAIARSLVNNPDIILADEPTGNLDSTSGSQVFQMLQKLHSDEKKTIILVTHAQELARYAERVVSIKDGAIFKISTN